MVPIHHLLCHCQRMMKLISLQQRNISFHLNWHVRAKQLGLLLLHLIVFRYATVIGCSAELVLKNTVLAFMPHTYIDPIYSFSFISETYCIWTLDWKHS